MSLLQHGLFKVALKDVCIITIKHKAKVDLEFQQVLKL